MKWIFYTLSQKKPVTTSYEKAALIVWNIFALFLVLTLCMLLWFARLYRSWACVKGNYDVLLLCQFTSQVCVSVSECVCV